VTPAVKCVRPSWHWHHDLGQPKPGQQALQQQLQSECTTTVKLKTENSNTAKISRLLACDIMGFKHVTLPVGLLLLLLQQHLLVSKRKFPCFLLLRLNMPVVLLVLCQCFLRLLVKGQHA
jgi:hypothetical protein